MSFYKACSERPSHILSAKKLTNQRIRCLVSFVRIETAITGMPRVFTTVGIMIRTWIHCWLTTTGDSKGMLHVFLYGASLSEPTLIVTTASACKIMVCTYVSMYHLPRVCRTLDPKIRVRPEILRIFQYIELLT